ncbi:MAG: ABC transporter ATP-binding protein [Aerococcus sp.]|nr:ABC transporter ATP-binding protein [Aerococcus sp.]
MGKEESELLNPIISVRDLSKCYHHTVKANNHISLDFYSGEIVALIGHNGAGKTTLLNQLIGLVKPTSGSIRINEIDVVKCPKSARQLISLMPQFQLPLKGVTISQAINSALRIKGFSKQEAKEKTENMMTYLRIQKWSNTPGENLSGGLQRLTSFAMSVSDDSPIVILDEPTNDVDPERRTLMCDYLRKQANEGRLVIVVTHNLLEVEKYADRYILLDDGKVKNEEAVVAQYSSNKRHVLNIYGIKASSVTYFSQTLDTHYLNDKHQLVISLKEREVLKTLGVVLKLLREGKASGYDMKIASLFESYEDMINETQEKQEKCI